MFFFQVDKSIKDKLSVSNDMILSVNGVDVTDDDERSIQELIKRSGGYDSD